MRFELFFFFSMLVLCYSVIFKGIVYFELFFYACFMLLCDFQGDCIRLNYFCISAF